MPEVSRTRNGEEVDVARLGRLFLLLRVADGYHILRLLLPAHHRGGVTHVPDTAELSI